MPVGSKGSLGGTSIGRVCRVRDSDVQGVHAQMIDVDAGCVAGPENDATVGVAQLDAGQDHSLLRQFVRILHVRREKEINRRAAGRKLL